MFHGSKIVLPLAIIAAFSACSTDNARVNAAIDKANQAPVGSELSPDASLVWPKLKLPLGQQSEIDQRISSILQGMTLEQKIAQMIQPEIRDISVEDMRRYGFGSYLNGGGAFPNNDKHATPADWIALAEAMYQASVDDSLDGANIPTMWGTDAVHGHNNVVGATLFPHNIGLGAANNPQLIEQVAAVTAREVMVTGIDWVFAPTVAVVRDDRWGRTYEGYSEDPDIVKAYSAAIVTGLQGRVGDTFLDEQHVISTVKHFLGDGGTEGGVDQGNNTASEQALFDIHAQGYVGGLTAGAQTVMASFNSWNGEKIHGDHYLMTQVLKQQMGFDGLVVGDWNGHGQIDGCSNESCARVANAGLDIYMVPTSAWKPLYDNTLAQARSGEIPMSRIDDAVSRILRVKLRAGLFEKPSPKSRPLAGKTQLIGSKAHRDIARQAVRESLVLLKNNQGIVPLSPKQRILVAGDAADNIGKQSGGWTITWQGTNNTNADFPGGRSIYAGLAEQVVAAGGEIELSRDGRFNNRPDVAIVVFGEEPYAEGNGDIDDLEYQRGNKRDLALLQSLKDQGIPVVSVFISGRPMWVNPELNASDAFVAAWLPGSEGDGIAQVLLLDAQDKVQYDFKGRLSFSWPARVDQTQVNRFDTDYQPLLPYGFGLRAGESGQLSNDLPVEVQRNRDDLVALHLFERTAVTPWVMGIAADGDNQAIIDTIQQNDVVYTRTIDKRVQEDARLFTFNGKAEGAVAIYGAFPRDLRGFSETQSVLSFDLQLLEPQTQAVQLSMDCEPSCSTSIDLSSVLAQLPVKSWTTITVDLNCFAEQGVDFSRVIEPFSLKTKGRLSMGLANIAILPSQADAATVSCQ
ncbi:exo 1,3/1,4-beta-D-glucan glucohydrolase [Shewanella mesophila]|uniref:glycoside hydrolase family 3 protein n=1 Tax=Shewanella mesophila TaxID=2864208 RepID=UPI001C657CDC|nr:exo 1,3/1,4-beta-D-glucan glucohydrolase [Shewanella mesophila]QYJ84978.1 exo 1,3/1,4-beta-D-glucan glucohydrolase [Shewanella mesophila]